MMNLPTSKSSLMALTALGVMGIGLILNPVMASVSPANTQDTLAPGEWVEYEKAVTLPEFPDKLDVCFLVDLSGSYRDDLPNIRTQMASVWDAVKAEIDDVRWCVGSFRDFPFSPWGGAGDYAYRLNLNLSPNKSDFTGTLAGLVAGGGNDGPESQYEALYEMATGAGNDVPPPGPSLGDVPAGQDPSWRSDATKVLIITTDAPFHNAGDPGPFPYPGPSAADTIDALVDASIKVIALKAPGSTAQMDALAAATGGSVQPTTAASDDIAEAVLDAFEALTFDVTGTPVGCDKLDISLDPDAYFDVPGGDTVYFDETIAVPADVTDVDNPYCCEVLFTADDVVVGVQEVCVDVKRTVAIDIKPGSFPNSINLSRDTGVIPVAILGSVEFDVGDVVFGTLTFGPGGQVPAHEAGHYEDVNGDGYMDLVSHYVIDGTGIASGDTEACISGKTDDGIDFMGCDSVRTIN